MSVPSDPLSPQGAATTQRDGPDLGDEPPDGGPIRAGSEIADRYWVLELIGSGGMGHVYRAYDARLQREVALKQLHVLGRTAERRLELEARAMAKLSHPNVVALYDVVLDETGLALAMEYVRGQTLREWLEAKRSWSEILSAFIDAGRGLAAAHRHGLIQRDFKPSNVLVSEDGRVRVTDFGVAKSIRTGELERGETQAAAGELTDDAAPELTSAGTLVGTVRYMSPEQHDAREANAKSDQYAFCLALWESLTGEDAFGSDTSQMAASKRAGPPAWPSAVVLPRPVVRALERGLQADASARWPSMDALLAVLSATLQPPRSIAARATVAVFGAGVLGAIGWAWAADGPCQERSVEEALGGEWNAEVRGSLRDLIARTDVAFAEQTASRVVERLDAYAQQWVEASHDNCEATRVVQEQSELRMDQASLCLERSRVHFVGAVATLREQAEAGAIEHLTRMVSQLPAIARCRDAEWLAADVEPPASEAEASEVGRLQAVLARSASQYDAGNAVASLETANRIRPEVEATGYAPLIAQLERRRGDALVELNQAADGETALRRSFDLALRGGDDRAAASVARQLGHLRGIELGHAEEGLVFIETGLALAQRPSSRPRVRFSLGAMHGLLLQRVGRIDEGLRELRALRERARTELPTTDSVRTSLEATLGVVLYENGFNEDALEVHRAVFATQAEVLGELHPTTAGVRVNIAIALDALGRPAEAATELREAQRVFLDVYGEAHSRTALCELNLSVVAANLGEYDAALASADRALEQFETLYGPGHPTIGRAQSRRAVALSRSGRSAEAQSAYRAAVGIAEANGGPQQLDALRWRVALARVMSEAGELEPALLEAQAVLAVMEDVLPEDHVERDAAAEAVGEMLVESGRAAEAVPVLERIVASFERRQLRPTAQAVVSFKLARALADAGESQRAVVMAKAARETLVAAGGYATDQALLETIDDWLATPHLTQPVE